MLCLIILNSIINIKNQKYYQNINSKNKYIILTIHRSQNLININNLKNIMKCFNELSKNIKIVFPVHPNTKI